MTTSTPTLGGWMRAHKLLTALFVVFALGVIGSFTEETSSKPASERAAGASDTPVDDAKQDEASGGATDDGEVTPAVAKKDRRNSRPPAKPKPKGEKKPKPNSPRTVLVTRVVDGDTLELGSGDTVRVVGIDTPEVGECGFDKATANLSYLTLGKQVTLTVSDEDRDQYGRLLRYVDVGGLDAGLRLIQNGLAIARYDSRDGYGFHAREPQYIAADKANANIQCAAPRPFAAVPAQGGACAPGYTPCVPPFPPDVDCGDVNGPVSVSGTDPHGLDADGDGTACE